MPNGKPIRWSPHARQKALRREIPLSEAENAVRLPELVAPASPPRQTYMRRYFDSELEVEMLLRVVVEETKTELVIVTLYKTSKFRKYGVQP